MKSYGERVLRLGFLNLELDGGPEEEPGVLPERWRKAHEDILVPLNLDWLGRAEMTHSQSKPSGWDAGPEGLIAAERARKAANRRFEAAQDLLGMRGFRASMGSGITPTGIFFRESTFRFVAQREHPRGWGTPLSNVTLTLAEAPEAHIETAAWHASYSSPAQRELETEALSILPDKVQAKYGNDPQRRRVGFFGFGDSNEYPKPDGETVPPIDWTSPEVTDLVHRRHRAIPQPDGSWESCTYLDQFMLDIGMHDPARYAAHQLGQPDALAATHGHQSDGQGGPCRIDRAYMDPWLVRAVLDVNVVPADGVSDHHGLEVILSRRKAVECLRRTIPPLGRWALVM